MLCEIVRADGHVCARGFCCPLCLRLRDPRDVDAADMGLDVDGGLVCIHCVADHAEWAAGRVPDMPEPWEFADEPAANDADAAE